MKPKPKLGQILYSLNVGNATKYGDQKLTRVTVTKVGRKYFTCRPVDRRLETQYYLDDWKEKTDFTPDSALYINPQEWRDEKEAKRICRLIRETFRHGDSRVFLGEISLNKLRVIEKIIITAKNRNLTLVMLE